MIIGVPKEIKLQELKIKKLELEDELDTNQKDDELDTNQTMTRSLTRAEYLNIKYPVQSRIVAFGIMGLMGLFILYMAFFYESDSQQSSSNTNSEISKTYNGCDGLEKMIDNRVIVTDPVARIQLRSQVVASGDEAFCQRTIDTLQK